MTDPSTPVAADRAAGAAALGQSETPYLDALRAYAERDPGRFHVPGHKGGPGADPALVAAIGKRALALDIPALTPGIDVGPEPTPFQRAQELAAEAWGAGRTWFLINGASQGNHAAALTLAHLGEAIVVQRNAHSSTIDGVILSGLRPTFVAPEIDPELGIAHCLTPEALGAALRDTDGVVGATAVSPTYFGAVADVRGLAEVAHARGVPLVADDAWGELLEEAIEAMAATRAAVREVRGLDVLDERLVGRRGVHDYDPLRLAIDVRGTGATGYQVAPMLRELGDINLELFGENVMVAVFGMGERVAAQGARLVEALRRAVDQLDAAGPREHEAFAPPPPWGELAMGPREAFLGPQEVVPAERAVGRV